MDRTLLYGSTTEVETWGGWVHRDPELGFLAVINRQALQEEGTKARSRSSTNNVEDEEAL